MPSQFKPALVIIDLQEDFLPPNGSLAVPDGRTVISVINELTELPWVTIIASKDWHPSDHCSFAVNNPNAAPFDQLTFSSPDGSGLTRKEFVWPVHCVQNSPGAEFPEAFTGAKRIDNVVNKGFLSDREYYSAFKDIWGIHHTELASLLKSKDITDVFVVGLAFDFCVLHSSVDAAKLGWPTHVIREGTKPVDPKAWDASAAKLEANGVDIIGLDSPLLSKVKSLVAA